jgi:CheY-like chemotaxis protein
VGNEPSSSSIPPEVRGALVLFVDDEPVARAVAEKVLGWAGFVTETLGDGSAALERRFQDPVPAVIFMNWAMAGMFGDEAIRLIRAREAAEGLPHVRIVLESANVPLALRRGADADATLSKPFSPEQLIAAVVHAMGHELG